MYSSRLVEKIETFGDFEPLLRELVIFARVSPLALPITGVSTTQTAACGKLRSSSWEEEDRTLMIQNA